MPYNTTAIPPRGEPTGTTQLPLSRVKKIIAQDQDINLCSNNAAFVITLAAEMFIQHLSTEAHTQAKLDKKPRRNVQYKDVANAVAHQDNLEFLEDIVPRTVQYKKVKDSIFATQAKLRGDKAAAAAAAEDEDAPAATNGAAATTNGDGNTFSVPLRVDDRRDDDANEQLELEMRQASQTEADEDVEMRG